MSVPTNSYIKLRTPSPVYPLTPTGSISTTSVDRDAIHANTDKVHIISLLQNKINFSSFQFEIEKLTNLDQYIKNSLLEFTKINIEFFGDDFLIDDVAKSVVKKLLDQSEINELKCIGFGSDAEIFCITESVVAKVLQGKRNYKAQDPEVKAVRLKVKGVLKASCVAYINDLVALVMPQAKCDLQKELASEEDLTKRLEIVLETATALSVLHESDYVHDDLKPANIFRMQNGEIKIGDLGNLCSSGSKVSLCGSNATHIRTPMFGTSPQFLKAEDYFIVNKAQDMWSMGILLLRALMVTPFDTGSPFLRYAIGANLFSKPYIRVGTIEELNEEIAKLLTPPFDTSHLKLLLEGEANTRSESMQNDLKVLQNLALKFVEDFFESSNKNGVEFSNLINNLVELMISPELSNVDELTSILYFLEVNSKFPEPNGKVFKDLLKSLVIAKMDVKHPGLKAIIQSLLSAEEDDRISAKEVVFRLKKALHPEIDESQKV